MVHKKGSVNMKKRIQKIMLAFALSVTMITGVNISPIISNSQTTEVKAATIPKYTGKIYAAQNKNRPKFSKTQLKNRKSYEKYGKLDKYGRCTTAIANVGRNLMPTTERGAIGMIKPTGWHTVKYNCVNGKYLYNRCHLIGYQLTGENANRKNLITGTRSKYQDCWNDSELLERIR